MRALALQFLRFGTVGFVAFCVTTLVVYATRGALGPTFAAIPAYLAGITCAWALNRSWTFGHRSTQNLWAQWLHYAVWTGPSLVTNITVYEIAVLSSAFVYAHPVVATALGSSAGMLVSFVVLRMVVFRQRAK